MPKRRSSAVTPPAVQIAQLKKKLHDARAANREMAKILNGWADQVARATRAWQRANPDKLDRPDHTWPELSKVLDWLLAKRGVGGALPRLIPSEDLTRDLEHLRRCDPQIAAVLHANPALRRERGLDRCTCGGVIVDVPTCGQCGESWLDQRACVLMDFARADKAPCAQPLSYGQICALEVGHAGVCKPDRDYVLEPTERAKVALRQQAPSATDLGFAREAFNDVQRRWTSCAVSGRPPAPPAWMFWLSDLLNQIIVHTRWPTGASAKG